MNIRNGIDQIRCFGSRHVFVAAEIRDMPVHCEPEGCEGQLEGSEGQPEGIEGHPEGSEGQPKNPCSFCGQHQYHSAHSYPLLLPTANLKVVFKTKRGAKVLQGQQFPVLFCIIHSFNCEQRGSTRDYDF